MVEEEGKGRGYAWDLSKSPKLSGGATLWQSSANALPVYCHALPDALSVFYHKKAKPCQ